VGLTTRGLATASSNVTSCVILWGAAMNYAPQPPHDSSSPEALPQPPLIPSAVLYTYVRCACSVRVRDGPNGLEGAAAAAAELQGRADGAEEVVLATADGAPPPGLRIGQHQPRPLMLSKASSFISLQDRAPPQRMGLASLGRKAGISPHSALILNVVLGLGCSGRPLA
jgi:hypothetical protein